MGLGDDFSLLGKLKWKFHCCHSIFDHSLMAFCSKSFPPNIQIVIQTISLLSIDQAQGWAGIPVPLHSQEWKPLIPVPELWGCMFSFPSRSRIMGMLFFIPFPFPNCGNDFFIPFPFPNLPFHENRTGNWNTVRDSKLPIFLTSSTFLSTIYIEVVN